MSYHKHVIDEETLKRVKHLDHSQHKDNLYLSLFGELAASAGFAARKTIDGVLNDGRDQIMGEFCFGRDAVFHSILDNNLSDSTSIRSGGGSCGHARVPGELLVVDLLFYFEGEMITKCFKIGFE